MNKLDNLKWFMAAVTMGSILFMFSEYLGG